eukprot:6465639-Prymnesium_polylepis.1
MTEPREKKILIGEVRPLHPVDGRDDEYYRQKRLAKASKKHDVGNVWCDVPAPPVPSWEVPKVPLSMVPPQVKERQLLARAEAKQEAHFLPNGLLDGSDSEQPGVGSLFVCKPLLEVAAAPRTGWTCAECGKGAFAWRATCHRCGANRPSNVAEEQAVLAAKVAKGRAAHEAIVTKNGNWRERQWRWYNMQKRLVRREPSRGEQQRDRSRSRSPERRRGHTTSDKHCG